MTDLNLLSDEPIGRGRDPQAFDLSAMLVLDLLYGVACSFGDSEAFIHTIGEGGWAIGDCGPSGELVDEGYAKTTLVRFCTGNAEACWLWELDALTVLPFGAVLRVVDYYNAHGYQRTDHVNVTAGDAADFHIGALAQLSVKRFLDGADESDEFREALLSVVAGSIQAQVDDPDTEAAWEIIQANRRKTKQREELLASLTDEEKAQIAAEYLLEPCREDGKG